jgi:hypothetical protein
MSTVVRAVAAALALAVTTAAAEARCTRLAFSVNDYGKEGPTKDAMKLLDGHIAKWAAENGIKGYKVGKKTVSCELYLDLIIFDEYTCKAEAPVCWDGGPATTTATSASATGPAKAAAPKAPPAERVAPAPKTKPAT